MNNHKLFVSGLMLVCVLLSACAPAPMPVPTAVPTVPPAGRVLAEWEVSDPAGMAFAFGSVWVGGHHSLSTTRIDPVSNTVSAVITGTGFRSEQLLAVGNALWVTGQSSDTSWIDPTTNTVTTTARQVQGELHHIAYGFDSLWATTGNDQLDRIDPATSKVIVEIEWGFGFPDNNINDVTTSAVAVWVNRADEQELIRIDPATNSVVSKTPYSKLISDAQALARVPAGKGTDFIWEAVAGGLLRIDPDTGAGLTFLPLDFDLWETGSFVVAEEAVWVSGKGQVRRVDVASNQIDATYPADPGITYIGVGFGSVWLVNYNESLVQRLDLTP